MKKIELTPDEINEFQKNGFINEAMLRRLIRIQKKMQKFGVRYQLKNDPTSNYIFLSLSLPRENFEGKDYLGVDELENLINQTKSEFNQFRSRKKKK